jgi:hypothetical protein
MPDLNMTLPTPSDIGVHPELKMSIKNRKLKYLLNGWSWRSDSNIYPHIFEQA